MIVLNYVMCSHIYVLISLQAYLTHKDENGAQNLATQLVDARAVWKKLKAEAQEAKDDAEIQVDCLPLQHHGCDPSGHNTGPKISCSKSDPGCAIHANERL
jgi:hypothetical protein